METGNFTNLYYKSTYFKTFRALTLTALVIVLLLAGTFISFLFDDGGIKPEALTTFIILLSVVCGTTFLITAVFFFKLVYPLVISKQYEVCEGAVLESKSGLFGSISTVPLNTSTGLRYIDVRYFTWARMSSPRIMIGTPVIVAFNSKNNKSLLLNP